MLVHLKQGVIYLSNSTVSETILLGLTLLGNMFLQFLWFLRLKIDLNKLTNLLTLSLVFSTTLSALLLHRHMTQLLLQLHQLYIIPV